MLKRLFDVLASGAALTLLSPVFLGIAVLVALDSSGPVFYRQLRIGRGEKPFRIFKFRTMVDGADRQGPPISVGGDPRVTRVGQFLRRFELDELPTLFNVFAGDMSIVGPRPETPKYLSFYTPAQRRVFSVRPGMTDLGTLNFRNEGRLLAQAKDPETLYVERILPEKLKLNLEYIERHGFFYDLVLIFKTLALIAGQKKG